MTTSPVPSDTDQPADPIAEHAERMAAVPDEAVDIAAKMLEQVVSGHLIDAAETVERGDGDFEDYSPHPASIESDACAIVAAVTPILTASLQARLTTAEEHLATVNAKSESLSAKLKDFLDGQSRIAQEIGKTTDKFEQQRLLGLAEARATLRSALDGDDDFMAPTIRACTGCGKCDYCAYPARALGLGEGDSDA